MRPCNEPFSRVTLLQLALTDNHAHSHVVVPSLPPSLSAMSLFDYQPGELSLLLNPNAQPDVYQWTKPAQLATARSNKRTLESAEQHNRQPKKKKVDKSQPDQTSRKDETDEHDQADGNDDEEEVTTARPEDDGDDDDDDDDDDGELSDLSDLDDSDMYADMDPATARQLRKQKRLHEDALLEQQQQQNKPKRKPNTPPESDPRLPRTLFVGNVPTSATRQQLTRFFKQFGAVESCRLRSFSVSNPKLTRRVAMIKGAIHAESRSMNAYVVFEAAESVESAVAKSGIEYEGHKLRLDYADRSRSAADKTKAGVSSAGLSVFVGNLPFNVSEQQLYDVFDGCGDLTAVRVVRDPLLSLGKGFAFVTFGSSAAVKRALAMQGVAIDGRELRLTRAMDETKARQVRDKRRQDAQPTASGAARRLQEKVKHAERKAAAAAVGGGRGERKGGVYVGEVSNPLEYVQKARRVEKKQKMKKEERRKKRSLVKVKKPRMKATSGGDKGKAASKKTSQRKDES